MESQIIQISARDQMGSAAVGRLRKQGHVPGVVYGAGKDAVPISVELKHYRRVLSHSKSPVYKLESADSALNNTLVFIKDEQMNYLKGQLLHFDLLAVQEDKEIKLEVPIEIIGECEVVKQGAAMLNQGVYHLEVSCLPGNIPQKISVDISSLRIGHAILASDLVLPAGVRLESDEDTSIVSASTKKAEEASATASPAAAPAAEAAAKKS